MPTWKRGDLTDDLVGNPSQHEKAGRTQRAVDQRGQHAAAGNVAEVI